jgi:hypothetical protein
MTFKHVSLATLLLAITTAQADVTVNIYDAAKTKTTTSFLPKYKPTSKNTVVDLSDAPKIDWDKATTVKRNVGSTVTPAFMNAIKPSDINHNAATSSAMLTINNPGRYYISQDLVPKFQSGKTGVTVLRITANNVTLDFNRKAIRVHPDSDTSGSNHTGLACVGSLYNVILMNGDVHGHNGNALVLDTGINLPSGTKDAVIHDMHVTQCKVDGIAMTSINGLRMEKTSVTNCSATASSAGLKATTCNDLNVKDCWFNNNDTTTGAAHGIHLIDCANAVIKNVNASSNTSSATSSASSHGIRLETSSGGNSNVVFENIVAVNNKVTGSAGGDSYGIKLEASTKNCTFNNVDASGNGDGSNSVNSFGLHAASAQSCVFKDLKISNNDAVTSATGVHLDGCTDFAFTDVNASNNNSVAAYGYRLLSSCKACSFINCGTANNSSTAGVCSGFDVAASPGNRYKNCYSNNNSAAGGQCSGFKFSSAADGNRLENCEALDNSGDAAVHGFSFESVNGNQLVNCQANEGSSSDTGAVCGFNFSGSVGNTLNNCEANHSVASGAAPAYGFSLASTSKNNQFSNCHSSSCTTGLLNQVAAGFRSNASSGNIFQNCNSIGHSCAGTGTLSSGAIQQYACGFLFQNGENASRVIKCQADNNDGGAGEGVGFGIYLEGNNDLTDLSDTSGPTNITVKDCSMSFNTSSGTSGNTQGNKYGFCDNHRDTTSVLINNISLGHGRCIATLDTSYNFVDPSNTSSTSGMNFCFKHTGTDENPANMIHETDIFNWTTLSTSVPHWMNTSIVTGQVAAVS